MMEIGGQKQSKVPSGADELASRTGKSDVAHRPDNLGHGYLTWETWQAIEADGHCCQEQ